MKIKIKKHTPITGVMPKGYMMFVFGHPKTGKTTNLAKWSSRGTDGVLLIDTDNNGSELVQANRIIVSSLRTPIRYLLDENGKYKLSPRGGYEYEEIPPEERGEYSYDGVPIESYALEEVISDISEMIIRGEFPYETIVIDTAEKIEEWCQQELAQQYPETREDGTPFSFEEIVSLFRKDFGIWMNVQRIFQNIFFDGFDTILKRNGINLIFTAHSKDSIEIQKPAKGGKTEVEHIIKSQLGKKVDSLLCAKAMIIAYAYKTKKGEYLLSCENHGEMHTGSRIKGLKDRTFSFDFNEFQKLIMEETC